MAYPLPTDLITRINVENLPTELLNFESGISDADDLETIRVKMIKTRDAFTKVMGSLQEFKNLSPWGNFFKWQVIQRLSPLKYEAFKNYNNNYVASKSGGITDTVTNAVSQVTAPIMANHREITTAAVVAISGGIAAGVLAGGATAAALPTLTAPTLPTLPTLGTIAAPIIEDAKKNLLNQINKTPEQPQTVSAVVENKVEKPTQEKANVRNLAIGSILVGLLFLYI